MGICLFPLTCIKRRACRCHDDGAGVPPPAPAPSLVAGAIDRSVDEARERYRAELVAMWHEVVEALPDD